MNRHRVFALLVLITPAAGLSWACERDGDAAETATDHIAQAEAPTDGVTAGPNYTIVHPAVTMTVAEPGQLELRVTPASGFKVNTEYPWQLTLEAEAPVEVPQAAWDAAGAIELTDDQALYQVPVTVDAAGAHRVDGHLRFSVCNEARCDVLQAEVAWAVSAE